MRRKNEVVAFTLGIGITAKGVGTVGPIGLVSLTKMKSSGKVGSKVDDENTVGPTTRILFATPESVDALIAELKPVARKMRAFYRSMSRAAKKLKTKPLEITINATDHSTTRHSDKRRKVSRKRTKR